jgi:hypothetical protein
MRQTRHVSSFIRGERGAILIQVGLSIFVLMAFNVFVLDYGMLWIARSQAQNAADAGALAGAVARGYDDRAEDLHPVHSLPARIAGSVAANNLVWNQSPAPVVSFACPPGFTGNCTRVDVHRDGNGGSNELSPLFGPVLGVTGQRVRATATAVNGNGNAVTCMSPLAFADEWQDNNTSPPGEFRRYVETTPPGPLTLVPNPDQYTPPGGLYPGRVTVSADYGERIAWVIDHAILEPITRERMFAIDLPGGRTFEQNMANCSSVVVAPGQRLRMITTLHPDEIETALNTRFETDESADYDYGTTRITNSCAPACAPISPRLVAVALFDPEKFQRGRATNDWQQPEVGCQTPAPCITVTNILGFFLHRMEPTAGFGPHGHFLRYPGVLVDGPPQFVDDGSWLVTTHLIR